MRYLTLNEEVLLLAIVKLKEKAYPVSIRDEVMKMTKKNLVYGTLYRSLDYVLKKGFVTSRRGEPTGEPGGKSKLFFSLTKEGVDALLATRNLQDSIWKDINLLALEEVKVSK